MGSPSRPHPDPSAAPAAGEHGNGPRRLARARPYAATTARCSRRSSTSPPGGRQALPVPGRCCLARRGPPGRRRGMISRSMSPPPMGAGCAWCAAVGRSAIPYELPPWLSPSVPPRARAQARGQHDERGGRRSTAHRDLRPSPGYCSSALASSRCGCAMPCSARSPASPSSARSIPGSAVRIPATARRRCRFERLNTLMARLDAAFAREAEHHRQHRP